MFFWDVLASRKAKKTVSNFLSTFRVFCRPDFIIWAVFLDKNASLVRKIHKWWKKLDTVFFVFLDAKTSQKNIQTTSNMKIERNYKSDYTNKFSSGWPQRHKFSSGWPQRHKFSPGWPQRHKFDPRWPQRRKFSPGWPQRHQVYPRWTSDISFILHVTLFFACELLRPASRPFPWNIYFI